MDSLDEHTLGRSGGHEMNSQEPSQNPGVVMATDVVENEPTTTTIVEPAAGDEASVGPPPPGKGAEPPRRRRRSLKPLGLGLAVVLLLANTAGVGYLVQRQQDDAERIRELTSELATAGTTLEELESSVMGARQVAMRAHDAAETANGKILDTAAVVQEVRQSVVTVQCGNSLGSGFPVWMELKKGYETAIITNYHVVEACTYSDGPKASISRGGKKYKTLLSGWDEKNDLALLFMTSELKRLVAAPPAKVGDPVIAIGSPFGLEGSVTTGIISRVEDDWYQTSALINPGNSGGPLLDREGRILGINTLSLGGGGSGVGGALRLKVTCDEIYSVCPYAD
ncbi:trypsin-like peptidase domain-containing protein [Intrasporangium calvum]|uniref:Trypsin-like peptidase domain-containing protein n=1 Tax=Intrasporangium calvum TaxID=53358 RepID=A0ABT5GKY0_9MICO|nr:trypsin-like peptidase domain-containing protein [Intrasporangium calvum]MDC5698356.1 trypsin-like peptidase domain-containing protein [Intrasporangium calvum]